MCNLAQQHPHLEAGPGDGMVQHERGHRAVFVPVGDEEDGGLWWRLMVITLKSGAAV